MKKPIEFLPEAEAEYLSALSWYRERSLAAAANFEAEFKRAIESVGDNPERWAYYLAGCRRFLLHQYPFAIVYQDSPNLIQVLACGSWSSAARLLAEPALSVASVGLPPLPNVVI